MKSIWVLYIDLLFLFLFINVKKSYLDFINKLFVIFNHFSLLKLLQI